MMDCTVLAEYSEYKRHHQTISTAQFDTCLPDSTLDLVFRSTESVAVAGQDLTLSSVPLCFLISQEMHRLIAGSAMAPSAVNNTGHLVPEMCIT